MVNPAIPCCREINAPASKVFVRINVRWHGWRRKIIEWREEPDALKIFIDQVVQQKILDIAFEIFKQRKERRIACKSICERTVDPNVVPPDTLKRQIHPISNSSVEAPSSIDGHLSINSIGREDHHAAYCISDRLKSFAFAFGKMLDNRLGGVPASESLKNRIAGQYELANFGPVMQVAKWNGVTQNKLMTTRQRFAPEFSMILAKHRAINIWVLAIGIGSEIEIRVDDHGYDCFHYYQAFAMRLAE